MNQKDKINMDQQVTNIRDWYPHYAARKKSERRKEVFLTIGLVVVAGFCAATIKIIVSVLIST